MENDIRENNTFKVFCFSFSREKLKACMCCVLPTGAYCLLHIVSLVSDVLLACTLLRYSPITSVVLATLAYVPIITTLLLRPYSVTKLWLAHFTFSALTAPLLIAISLVKRFIWTTKSVSKDKPYKEVISEMEGNIPKEVHSYLFLQAFLQSAPRIILQTYLLILGVVDNLYTEVLQLTSILTSLVMMVAQTVKYHRYEAQVMGGRSHILLTEHPPADEPSPYKPLLSINCCLRSKLVGIEEDNPLGAVIAFFAWFCLLLGRTLVIAISLQTHCVITLVILYTHFFLMLCYLLSSQTTTLYNLHSRLLNATISLIALVEVSVRFHKMPLLYAVFFILLIVEDTYLMILFFIYPAQKCSSISFDCKHFGLLSYLIMNSHVLGVILFGIYLARFRPRMKCLTESTSTVNTVTHSSSYNI